MELSLKEAVSIVDVIKTIDAWSAVLWLSLTIPAFYIAIKKLTPSPQPADGPETLSDRIGAFFRLPQVEGYIIAVSLALFTIGTCIVVYGKEYKEDIRNKGWALKNHMINTGYFIMQMNKISQSAKIDTNDIKDIIRQFPKEFSMVYDAVGKDDTIPMPTVILSDSMAKLSLLISSEKILASYLNNDAVLEEGGIKSFDALYRGNEIFSYPVIYKLIADSGYRFSFNLMNVRNPDQGYGIVKLKRNK